MNYWIFQGNPDVFDIDTYLRENDDIVWQIRQKHLEKDIRLGDEVYIWRAAGKKGGQAGVVASAIITSEPINRADDEPGALLWREKVESAVALRAGLRITNRCIGPNEVIKRQRIAEDPILNGLRILRLGSETNYQITADQAQRLALLIRNTGSDTNPLSGMTTPFIVVGNKGTALPVNLFSLDEHGLNLGQNHIRWKSENPSPVAKDAVAWVSKRGEPVEIYLRDTAIKDGIIKALTVSWQKNGKSYHGTAFLPSAWDESGNQPQYVAVECGAWPYGVVESKTLPGQNNEHVVAPLNFSAAIAQPQETMTDSKTPVVNVSAPFLNYDKFLHCLEIFRNLVLAHDGRDFTSFESGHSWQEEGYKIRIYEEGRRRLGWMDWTDQDVGNGSILKRVIDAIEIKDSNLVDWDLRRGPDARSHHALCVALEKKTKLIEWEALFFDFYRDELSAGEAFEELIKLAGGRYDLIAYLFYLKDASQFAPIAPKRFDTAFEMLGVELKTSRQCSFENYQAFLGVLRQVRDAFRAEGYDDVRLIDAHSFCWMIARNRLPDQGETAAIQTQNLPSGNSAPGRHQTTVTRVVRNTEVVYAVKGLHEFTCQICGCQLLTPSGRYAEGCHIKPLGGRHNGPDVTENVLCLCPNCHVLFDEIAVWVNDDLTLCGERSGKLRTHPRHDISREFLKYHRELGGR